MKPQVIDGRRLTYAKEQRVVDWLRANGCPWLISADERIHVTGNYFTVRTWTVKTVRQTGTMWPRRIPEGWKIPTKLRKYRIRVELKP